MRERRRFEAGGDLFRARAAANGVAWRFENERLEAGLREIGGAGEAIHASADDQHVVRRGHLRTSFRMRSAAFFPGAPMMPPPGCVADPHM